MPLLLRALLPLCLLALLSGCSIAPRVTMSAEAVMPARKCTDAEIDAIAKAASNDPSRWLAPNCTSGSNLARVHQLVQDSEQKCANFVVGMFDYQARTSTGLDIAATTFSALATVFTRIGIKNTLSAGSSIATGSRNSIHTEYLNSLTIANVVQAVQSTYGIEMKKYLEYLSTQVAPDVDVERSWIVSIHNLCSLPAAEGTIQASVAPARTPSPPSDQLTLTYTVKAAAKGPSDVAADFAREFSATPDFQALGVGASAGTPPTNVVKFDWPNDKVHSITWTGVDVVGLPDPNHPGRKLDPGLTAQFSADFSTITFGGTPHAGETLTMKTDVITLKAAGSAPAAPPPVAAPAGAAPAAALGFHKPAAAKAPAVPPTSATLFSIRAAKSRPPAAVAGRKSGDP